MLINKLNKLLDRKNEAEWRSYLCELSLGLGFDCVLIGVMRSRHASIENCIAHSNLPNCWHQHYISSAAYNVDPTILHCLSSQLPLIWTRETLAMLLRGIEPEFGSRAGITFPLHGSNGEIGLLSLAAKIDIGEQFDYHLRNCIGDLSLLRDYAFHSLLRFLNERKTREENPCLTARQLEILKWVAKGKSSWEIARILDCSMATVNFHISHVRQKYDVATRGQAVTKAISLGMLVLK